MATNEVKANNALRLIALSTTDSAIALLALDVLEESESEAKSELNKTCYADQIDNLRAAVLTQNSSSYSNVMSMARCGTGAVEEHRQTAEVFKAPSDGS